MVLRSPLDTFRLEKRAGEYKAFVASDDDPYPLKGVTYPTDYGDIAGYTAEDGAGLDLFVGTDKNGLLGFIKVWRPELPNGETKIFTNVTESEEAAILEAFEPVLTDHGRFDNISSLQQAIKQFKQS